MPQELVSPPITSQFHRSPAEIAVILLQLGLKTAEQGKGVRGRSRKSRNDLVVVEPPDLLGRMLDHRFPKRDLAISGKHDLAIAAHRQNRRRSDQSLRTHERNLRL